jgi:hypothetical protein
LIIASLIFPQCTNINSVDCVHGIGRASMRSLASVSESSRVKREFDGKMEDIKESEVEIIWTMRWTLSLWFIRMVWVERPKLIENRNETLKS